MVWGADRGWEWTGQWTHSRGAAPVPHPGRGRTWVWCPPGSLLGVAGRSILAAGRWFGSGPLRMGAPAKGDLRAGPQEPLCQEGTRAGSVLLPPSVTGPVGCEESDLSAFTAGKWDPLCRPAGPGLAAPGTLETTLARILCRLQHSTPARSPPPHHPQTQGPLPRQIPGLSAAC